MQAVLLDRLADAASDSAPDAVIVLVEVHVRGAADADVGTCYDARTHLEDAEIELVGDDALEAERTDHPSRSLLQFEGRSDCTLAEPEGLREQ